MRIKCVIFDFDGTLADSKAVFISVYDQIALKYGYRQIEAEGLQHLRTLTIKERCRYLRVPLYRIPFLAKEFLVGYKTALPQIQLFGGIKELLERLNVAGIETAVISSNGKDNISRVLTENAVSSVTKIHCSANLFGKHKLITGFLKKYQLNADEVLYIGDEARDIVACKKAGVKVVWVDWGYDVKEVVADEKPDYMVSRPFEILALVLSLTKIPQGQYLTNLRNSF